MQGLPEEGAQVVVVLPVSQVEIRFRAQARQITENDQPASFGIEFRETPQKIESKLIRLMDILYPSDQEEESKDESSTFPFSFVLHSQFANRKILRWRLPSDYNRPMGGLTRQPL